MSAARHEVSTEPVAVRMGIDEFATLVRMSARSIRAYQARGLLPPPERIGKRVYYLREHRKRIETIQRLQRQGFNLVSISAVLGEDAPAHRGDALADFLARVDADDPAISGALAHHGVLGRARAGDVVPLRPRLIRAALQLQNFGVPARTALRVVAEILDQLEVTADVLAAEVSTRIIDCVDSNGQRESTAAIGADLDAELLGTATAAMLDEAFRVVIEASCARRLVQLLDERSGGDDHFADPAVDVG